MKSPQNNQEVVQSLFSQQINLLATIYDKWQNLEPKNKLARIDFILPFVSLAGVLCVLDDSKNEDLQNIRKDFKEFYEKNHPLPLQWQSSDFSDEIKEKLQKISDSPNEIMSATLIDDLMLYAEKYRHAHFVAQFYLQDILRKGKNEENFLENIQQTSIAINKRLESNFESPDDLERHALLNQLSGFLQSLQDSAKIIDKDAIAKEYLQQIDPKNPKAFTKNTSSQIFLLGNGVVDTTDIISGFATIKAGIETEISSSQQLSKPDTIFKKIAFLKRLFVDIEPRRNMAKKYGIKFDFPEINWEKIINSQPQLLDTNLVQKSYLNEATFNLVATTFTKNLPEISQNEINNTVATMLPEEALAFLLLFNQEKSDVKIKFDDIPNDISEVYQLIKSQKFYQKTVDMIYAMEIDVFLDEITEEKVAKIPEIFKQLNYWGNFVGYPITKMNEQVNFSFADAEKDLIDYQPNVDDGKLKATISGVGVEILKTIQETLQKIDAKHSIFRDSKTIAVGFDAKKCGDPDFFAKSVAKFSQDHPNSFAFAIHKQVAGKVYEIRVSKIDNATIVEARMIGCNPHNPTGHIGQHDFAILPKLITEIHNAVQTKLQELKKNPEEYQKLLQKRVPIVDGRVEEISPILRELAPQTAVKKVVSVVSIERLGFLGGAILCFGR